MKRSARVFAMTVAAGIVGTALSLDGVVADASSGQVEVVAQYTSANHAGQLTVSPDGNTVVFPLFGQQIDFQTPPLLGVRLVDLTDTTRDQTIMFPVPAISDRSYPPYAFSRDGALLLVDAEFELFAVDVASFQLLPSIPLFAGDFSILSPTMEFLYEWVYSSAGNPSLFVWSTLAGDIIFGDTLADGDLRFSDDGERLYVSQKEGILDITLAGGTAQFISLDGLVTLGIPRRVVEESSSGNILVVELTAPNGFPSTGLAFVDRQEGRVLVEIPLSGPDTYIDVVTFSPDETLAVFSQIEYFDGGGSSSLNIVDLGTGEVSPWDEALLGDSGGSGSVFPVMSTGASVWLLPFPASLLTVDWQGPTIDSQRLLAAPPGQSGTWEPLKHFPDTDELLLVATDLNFDNYDYGEWPDRPESGTITATYTFERISLVEQTGFAVRGSAFGFDETGTIGVSFTQDAGALVSVWDLANQSRIESFPVKFADESFSDSGFVNYSIQVPGDGSLMVSQDGQTVYLVIERYDVSFDAEDTPPDTTVWAMSTQTGELTEVVSFPQSSLQVFGYNVDGDTLLVAVRKMDTDWNAPLEVLEIGLSTRQQTALFSVREPDNHIIRTTDGQFVMFGFQGATALDGTTGQKGRQLLFPAGADVLRISVTPDGSSAVGVGNQVQYSTSGVAEPAGGFVAMGAIPGGDSDSDQLADQISQWSGAGGSTAAFSRDGTILYVVSQTGVSAYGVANGEPLEVKPVTVSLPASFTPQTAVVAPDGQTVWVGVGSEYAIVAFYPVALPELIEPDQVGQSATLFALADLPGWVIPGVALVVASVFFGVWLRRSRQPSSLPGEGDL